jgi:hypothetical protein
MNLPAARLSITPFMLWAALAISGCLKESTTVEIDNFTVVDSYNTSSNVHDPDSPIAINASIINGAFNVQWDVDSSESSYYVELSISTTQLNGGVTLPFYDARCGADIARYSCNRQVTIQCHFSYGIELSCGDIAPVDPFNIPADVTGVITALPIYAYLRMRACTPDLSTCATRYQLVEWQ